MLMPAHQSPPLKNYGTVFASLGALFFINLELELGGTLKRSVMEEELHSPDLKIIKIGTLGLNQPTNRFC